MPPLLPSIAVRPALITALVVLGFAGCREGRVAYYEVPHEEPAPVASMAGTGEVGAPARPAGAQLTWEKPAGWTEQPPSAMRLGSYAVTLPDGGKVDVSVTTFPDSAGGLLANINRWRGQVGLEAVTEADLATSAERTEIAGLASWVVDFTGTPPGKPAAERILGAIVPVGGSSWFFKVSGPDAAVQAQREPFRALLASVRAVTPTETAAAAAAPPASDPHAGVDLKPSAMAAAAGSVPPPPRGLGFSFTAPESWQQQASTQFRVVNFTIPGPGVPAAEFYVTPLSGAAGGELANVNRWRGQLGLPPMSEGDLARSATTLTSPAGAYRIYDFASTGPGLKSGERARMLAAIHERSGTSWFFKMTGEVNHVATLRESFEGFLRSCAFEQTP